MATLDVCEIFESIQGESSYAGLPCFFVRLAGCNLHCKYCDTPEACAPGTKTAIDSILDKYRRSTAAIAEVTGGEPLLQPGTVDLLQLLRDCKDRPVLLETNGSKDISIVPHGVITVMDVKCPGSGMSDQMDPENIGRLRPEDEVKFVIGNRWDYEWSRDFIAEHGLIERCHAVFFSPVFGVLELRDLGIWILDDGLGVRLGTQLHKLSGMK